MLKITESVKLELKKQTELDSSMDWIIACVWSKPKPDLRRNTDGKAEWGMYGAEGWRVAIIPSLGFDKSKIISIDNVKVYIGENLNIESIDFDNDVWLINGEKAIPYEPIEL